MVGLPYCNFEVLTFHRASFFLLMKKEIQVFIGRILVLAETLQAV